MGKTSLGRSIAQAMGRGFVRMSLGGMRDEAEIRGHRRTYVGALPGRIIQGMRQAGTSNPIFLLDEIDKIGADYRGDPAAALLEVLDPEQNHTFRDHYLNVPYDLSKTLFVATANLIDPIPRALLDRMEVIRLPGYTPEEKEVIARRYLVPRQIEECGLTPERVQVSRAAVREVISGYTQEAGVRGLERELGRLLRKIARRIAEGETERVSVNLRNLRASLGPAPLLGENIPRSAEAGLARGLAWTEAGGEVLVVEATMARGRGLLLRPARRRDEGVGPGGALYAALARRRARHRRGPREARDPRPRPRAPHPRTARAAGITMATAIVSLLTGIPVRADVAMTGEVTPRGRVLPVGGVREKVLAALRRGIHRVILPEANRHDLEGRCRTSKARKLEFLFCALHGEVLDPRCGSRRLRQAQAAPRGAARAGRDHSLVAAYGGGRPPPTVKAR